jgi:chromosome segregation ATPase
MNELFHCRAMVSALDDEAQKQMTKTNEGKMERERLNNEISCFRKKTENLQNHLTSQKSRGESIQVSLDDAIREMIPLKDEIISLQVEKEDIERDLASAKHECERLQAIVNEVKCARDCAVESLKLKDEEMKIITIQKVENSSKLCVHLTIFLTIVIFEMLLVPKTNSKYAPFPHLSSLGSNS